MKALRAFVWITEVLACTLIASSPLALADDPLQETTEAFFPFTRDGTLTVENTDGSIHIYGWNQPRVKLVALRKAYTAARLHQIQVETKAQENSIAVRTRIPAASGIFADRSGTVDYTIIVPAAANLARLTLVNGEIVLQNLRGGNANAEMMNGKVTALNCYARVKGRAVNGVLEVFYEWWEDLPAAFDFALNQGRILARLPLRAQFKLDAQTASGHVENEFGFKAEPSAGPGQLLKAATAADASVSLLFRTGGGNISIDAVR